MISHRVGRIPMSVLVAVVLVAGAIGIAAAGGCDPVGSRRADGPIHSQVVGFSPGALILDLSPAELEADLDAMADLGARWIRIDIDWSRIEDTEGAYDWSTTDTLITAARDHDLEVLALLTYTPAWARPRGTTDKHPPSDADDFARFAGGAVARYGPLGVSTWEVWNEPNSEQFWSVGPDPEGYGQLLVAASGAIRSADPSATVITGGLAPADDIDGVELSPQTYLSRLYEVVPREAFDAVAIHPYSYPAFPSDSQGWNTFAALPSLRRILVANGDEAKRIWLTEYGAPTGDHERAVTPERQAELVLDAVRTADRWDWVGPLFLYSHRDLPGGASDDPEANFGLRHADGEWKPAWPALKSLLADGEGDEPGS
ncbi:MAG: glycoside hydrolase family 5 protein [Actinomycetia bacterium]|nr:glycoside hydrolase family 5 protein [Actinomycetes bacterium]